MTGTKTPLSETDGSGSRLKKSERWRQIYLVLKLRPHVRIREMASRFDVSTETVRRDLDTLADDGLIIRAHGGASALVSGHFSSLDERATAQIEECERIDRTAAKLVKDDERRSWTKPIESGRAVPYLPKMTKPDPFGFFKTSGGLWNKSCCG